MRIIVTAGGSGGHIFPAMALASELERKGEGPLFFVASNRRLDRNILRSAAYPCFYLSANPMPFGLKPLAWLVFAAKLAGDIARGVYLILRLRPGVVVGFGGYASGAVSLCAAVFRIPLVIHEQNFLPGRANRILTRVASVIALSFAESGRFFSKTSRKMVCTGNPVRADLLLRDRATALKYFGFPPGKETILIMGGSQGSAYLNRVASRGADIISRKFPDRFRFIHLAGAGDYAPLKDFYAARGIAARVFPFLDRIELAYAVSDFAVSRAGAAAIFELAFHGIPMLLVPYPNPKNNQKANAVYFAEKNAAIYREETALSEESLAEAILGVLSDRQVRGGMSRTAKSLARPDAAARLAEAVLDLKKATIYA